MPITITLSVTDIETGSVRFYRDNSGAVCVEAAFSGGVPSVDATLAELVADGTLTNAQRNQLVTVLSNIRSALRTKGNLQP